MLQGFETIISRTINFNQVAGNLIFALMCGLFIAIIYRSTYKGPNYSPTFVQSIVLLSMITALVIMVIGNNLARAFGLVGAMSIIRFRTAVKDTQDIVFIFFSLAVGMAAGVGLKFIAVAGTGFIGLVLLILSHANFAVPKKEEFLIQFHSEMPEGKTPYLGVMEKHCKQHRLINMQSLGVEDMFELSFYVKMRNKVKSAEFIRELNLVPHLSNIRFFFDEEPV